MTDELNHKAVFLLTIDALNLNHLKVYGYHRETAPNLERYIKRGSIFYNMISNGPETPSAFSSIFTSILPFLDEGYSPLPQQKIPFPQILKENGIYTFGIHSNPNLGEYYNYHRGFNNFFDGERYKLDLSEHKKLSIKHSISYFLQRILNYKNIIRKLMYQIGGLNKIKDFLRRKIPNITELLLPFTPIAYNAPYIVSKIESFLEDFQKPLFMWAHFMDLHSPYNPPSKNILKFRNKDFTLTEKEFLNKQIYSNPAKYQITPNICDDFNLLYDAQISYLDEYLGSLIKIIQKYFKKNCLIIITADHGENLLDFGLTGHQGSIHDNLLKIPLFIIEIGKTQIVKNIYKTVQSIDIPCTILDYYNIEIPELYQGISLIPLMKGQNSKDHEYVISECFQKKGFMRRNNREGFKLISIKKDEYKYIFDEELDKELLFNIRNDPAETKNLIHKKLAILDIFREIKKAHIDDMLKSSKEKLKILKAIDALKL
ncbi:MAG: sulfatase-like hydrolase/transferase [Promethearchaeota archaeon]